MSVIGEQIRKYRIERGITQEQLGQMIGVTTQAVSRWERGGTPDAELLPDISSILDVSIDALFGRNEESLPTIIARRLCIMPRKEAYLFAFNICWAIQIGLLGDKEDINEFLNRFIEHSIINTNKEKDYFSRIIRDEGISDVRISPDFHHFFLMLEPKDGVNEHLSDLESLRKVFELLADKKLLKIICYIYSMPEIPVASGLISKKTGIKLQEVDRCMDILCRNNITVRCDIATAEGMISSYHLCRETNIIPLLCFADEVSRNIRPVIGEYLRSKPFL